MQCKCLATLDPEDVTVEPTYSSSMWELQLVCDDCGRLYSVFVETDAFVLTRDVEDGDGEED